MLAKVLLIMSTMGVPRREESLGVFSHSILTFLTLQQWLGEQDKTVYA